MYRQHLSETFSLLLGDVLLYRTMEMETCECAETSLVEERTGNNTMDSTLLVTALELVALEKLIAVLSKVLRTVDSRE